MKDSKDLFKEMIIHNMENMEEFLANDKTIPEEVKRNFLKLWRSVKNKKQVIALAKTKLDKMF